MRVRQKTQVTYEAIKIPAHTDGDQNVEGHVALFPSDGGEVLRVSPEEFASDYERVRKPRAKRGA